MFCTGAVSWVSSLGCCGVWSVICFPFCLFDLRFSLLCIFVCSDLQPSAALTCYDSGKSSCNSVTCNASQDRCYTTSGEISTPPPHLTWFCSTRLSHQELVSKAFKSFPCLYLYETKICLLLCKITSLKSSLNIPCFFHMQYLFNFVSQESYMNAKLSLI